MLTHRLQLYQSKTIIQGALHVYFQLFNILFTCNVSISNNGPLLSNGLFPPTETDSDSDLDSKPYSYIVLCTTFSTGSDSDSDPCMDSFLNGYCTHFRDGSPSQGSESKSLSVGGNEPYQVKNVTYKQ